MILHSLIFHLSSSFFLPPLTYFFLSCITFPIRPALFLCQQPNYRLLLFLFRFNPLTPDYFPNPRAA